MIGGTVTAADVLPGVDDVSDLVLQERAAAARRWWDAMRGVRLARACAPGTRTLRCPRVTTLTAPPCNSEGIWWNDEIGSTHVEAWGMALECIARPPESSRDHAEQDADHDRGRDS